MKNSTKGKIIKGAAVGLDVAAPAIVTFMQFPAWIEHSSEATISGMFLIFAAISCIPFINQIKQYAKSPSVPVVWIILLVALVALRSIIDQAVIICFVGCVANLCGAGLYKIGEYIENVENKE